MEEDTTFCRILDGGKIAFEGGDVRVEFPGLPREHTEEESFRAFAKSCDFPDWKCMPGCFTPDPAICHLLRLGDRDSQVSNIRLFVQYVGPVTLYYAREIRNGQICEFLSTPVVRLESGRGRTNAKEGDVTFFYAFVFKSSRAEGELGKKKYIDSLKSMFSDINRRHYSIQIDISPTDTDYQFSSKILIPRSGAVMQIQLPASGQPYPQNKAEWDADNVVPLLVASPQVQNAIFKLSEAWTNPTVKTILLTAPPGAGKEEYVKFLRAGFGTLSAGNGEEALPLPGKKPEQVEEYIRECASQWGDIQGKKGEGALSVLFGNTPVIFLDESDKAERDVRDALLRVLSARKLPGTREHKQEDLNEEVFVFTASTIYSDLLARVEPRDFWTRVQLTVESAHPLMIGSADDRLWIVQQYVKMFLERNLVKNKGIEKLARNRYGAAASEAVSELQKKSDMLAEQISVPLSRLCQIRIPSIRVVRTITDKIVWNMLAQGLGGTGQDDGEATTWPPRSPFDKKFKLSQESSKNWCDEYVPVFFLECFA